MLRSIILGIRRQRQEDHCKFKATVVYIESLKTKQNKQTIKQPELHSETVS